MKRIIEAMLAMLCVFWLSGCETKDIMHSGLNAEIIEINSSDKVIYVADSDAGGRFGDKCAIDCNELIRDQRIIYVDFAAEEVSVIRFSDLQIGDMLAIDAYESGLKSAADGRAKVEQIQLITQK